MSNHEFMLKAFKMKTLEKLIEKTEEVERLEKAISVCLDRMKEGGSGTRSFVYDTLKKALEGTK